MTPTNPRPKTDSGFSSFALGVSIGVVAALLFGTEEGRKIVKGAFDAVPEKYKKIPESILPGKDASETVTAPILTPFETPHHATYEFESPPPPPPAISLTRPH